eukprot:contig_10283_g2462
MLASWVGQADGALGMHFRGTTDITSTAETAALVQAEIERELQAAAQDNDFHFTLPSGLPNDLCRSMVIGFVSDSARPNVGAKQAISGLHPSLMMVACFAHELNLVTGFVVNHPSMLSAATRMSMVVKFFSQFTMWMAMLEVSMDECNGPRLSFVKREKTRRYSHCGMVRRILELKGALVAFGNKHNDDGSRLGTNHGAEVVELLRSRLYWHIAEAMSRTLYPVVIEIGLVERRGSGLADVCASYRQLYAYFLQLKKETASVSPNGSAATLAPLFAIAAHPSVYAVTLQLCTSVLRHLLWRLDKYNKASFLVLAHVVGPVRHTSGLQVGPRSYTRSAQLLPMFLALASRFKLPRSSAATAEHDARATV